MIQSVKLSKLRLSASNVRTAPDEALQIEPFAADLEARGVLQNLLVTPVSRPRGMFEVFDGGRRWRALNLLVERGVIDPETYEVPVRVLKGDDAALTETSLAVAFHTLKLSPAEECRAFQHFLNDSTDIDAVAKRFGVTRRFIDGRLRLAGLAEPIFTALANNEITLDMAKAYASTASHEAQLHVWQTYSRMTNYTPDNIRRIIATDMMRANDPVALLVGIDAYEAAGGTVNRDLFSDDGEKWLNPDIARTIAATMMEAEAARIGAERGLAWIRPIASHFTPYDVTRDLHRITLPEQPMTLEQAERAEQVEQRIGELHDEMQNEDLADDVFTKLETEMDALTAELETLENRPVFVPPELAPRVGAFLTLSQDGTMVLQEAYYSETPITVTVVEPDPVEGSESDDTEGHDATDRVVQATTFHIEEGTPTTRIGAYRLHSIVTFRNVEDDDVPLSSSRLERRVVMPFLPTTPFEFLRIGLFLIPVALVAWVIWRSEKQTAADTKVAIPADELRDLISTIPEERLRSRVREMVSVSAAERPVTKKTYDRIVLQAKNEAMSRDQVASLSTANA